MRFRTVALAAALTASFAHDGSAYVPQKGAEAPVVANGRAPRTHRSIEWKQLGTWTTQVDRDTKVPLRMWGPPIAAPNAIADAAAAEAAARAFIAQHLDALAPGSKLSDLALVANVENRGVRVVAFVQTANGVPVIGGSVGVTFKADRLILASSSALPNVSVRMPGGRLPAAQLATSAQTWLANDGFTDARATRHGERAILPIVRPRLANGSLDIEYRVVETVAVETTRNAGAWDVYLDANDASPVARRSTIMFGSGIVNYDVPDRYPGGTRSPQPARATNQSVNGTVVASAADGSVTWNGTNPASIAPALVGPLARTINKAGSLVTDTLTLQSGGSVTWSKAADEFADAQLSAYIYALQAKAFSKARLNPNLAWLEQQIPVNVNESQTCNAYSTGNDIHFFRKGGNQVTCENTARIADVVYHEFGHSLHANSVIPGQGNFDSALSEGLADTLAASITGDHGMGRGFFMTNAPLRDLDPVGKELKWPDDVTGEPHNDGEIIGETLWDLRKALELHHGQAAGFDKFLTIYYGVMQRSADIPSSYAEALVADDDDGNLANGTPNQCDINAAYGTHGLADPASTLGLDPPTRDKYTISINVAPPDTGSACPPPGVVSGVVSWNPRGGTGGDVPLVQNGNTWSAAIPKQPDASVVEYSVTVTLADGSSISYPQNAADPKYQFYVGNVTKIWCADFEDGVAWSHTATPTQRDEWEIGAPTGLAGDPTSAHGGTNVFGIDLTRDGLYEARTTLAATSPEIDLQGNTAVRLQYWRWLNVEDGGCDQASIKANGTEVWTNAATACETSGINHTDKEWRFQDVDLSSQSASGKLTLDFSITSDPGLELGGWTMDDVCIVIAAAPTPTCGDSTIDDGETCDDGNTVDGDGCSATCTDETTGGGGDEGGCCSAGGNPAGPIGLAVFTLGLVLVRRRRR